MVGWVMLYWMYWRLNPCLRPVHCGRILMSPSPLTSQVQAQMTTLWVELGLNKLKLVLGHDPNKIHVTLDYVDYHNWPIIVCQMWHLLHHILLLSLANIINNSFNESVVGYIVYLNVIEYQNYVFIRQQNCLLFCCVQKTSSIAWQDLLSFKSSRV